MEEHGEKTEKATPKKLQEAKKRGVVARSEELTGAFLLLTGSLSLYFFSSLFGRRLLALFRLSLGGLTSTTPLETVEKACSLLLLPLLGWMLLIVLLAFAPYLLQQGWIFTLEPLKRGLKSKAKFAPFYKSCVVVLKILVIGLIAIPFIKIAFPTLIAALHATPLQKGLLLFSLSFWLVFFCAASFFLLSLFDLLYQRWRFAEEMKMTKAEVDREKRETDGDTLSKERMKHDR